MSDFQDVLVGSCSNNTPDSLNLFGQFAGEWDFEWIDGKGTERERHVFGEWIFSWILEGQAIQDVFICPSRRERLINPQPDAEYGTTVRFYNSKKGKWDVCYGYANHMTILEAEQVGETIVLTNQNPSAGVNQWVFSKITPTTFHWQNRTSADSGSTWHVNGELYATRRQK